MLKKLDDGTRNPFVTPDNEIIEFQLDDLDHEWLNEMIGSASCHYNLETDCSGIKFDRFISFRYYTEFNTAYLTDRSWHGLPDNILEYRNVF